MQNNYLYCASSENFSCLIMPMLRFVLHRSLMNYFWRPLKIGMIFIYQLFWLPNFWASGKLLSRIVIIFLVPYLAKRKLWELNRVPQTGKSVISVSALWMVKVHVGETKCSLEEKTEKNLFVVRPTFQI